MSIEGGHEEERKRNRKYQKENKANGGTMFYHNGVNQDGMGKMGGEARNI